MMPMATAVACSEHFAGPGIVVVPLCGVVVVGTDAVVVGSMGPVVGELGGVVLSDDAALVGEILGSMVVELPSAIARPTSTKIPSKIIRFIFPRLSS